MGIQQIEYVDREHWNTVCVAEFVPVTKLEDVQPGDKIVVPKTEKYCGWLRNHNGTLYPVLFTVEYLFDIRCKIKNMGSFAYDVCFKMHNPN